MVQLKKFLFDNFIIEARPEVSVEPDVSDSETVPSVPEEEELPVEAAVEMPEEEEPEPEEEPDFREIEFKSPEEEQPAEKKYTQSEVDALLDNARQEGYEQGHAASQKEMEAEANRLWEDISRKLNQVLSDAEQYHREIEVQALEMVKTAVAKLVPTLMEQQASELVSGFIADNFNNFKDEAKLSFYIHPDIISYAQEKIASLANSYDFEGKIALHKDASLAKSDCRIEWENGGVELKSADRTAAVAALLDSGEDVKSEIKHDR